MGSDNCFNNPTSDITAREVLLADIPDLSLILIEAFPTSVKSSVENVLRVMPATHTRECARQDSGKAVQLSCRASISPGLIALNVDAECVRIPSRIYTDEPPPAALLSLSETERLVLACLYTRHNNGFVREKHLMAILKSTASWTVPFVLLLLGEYVIEIAKVVLANSDHISETQYSHFVDANPQFMRRLRGQIINYWSYYYRSIDFSAYPAYRILQQHGWWEPKDGHRLLRSRIKKK